MNIIKPILNYINKSKISLKSNSKCSNSIIEKKEIRIVLK